MINVIIADSQPILREGIKRLIEEDPGINVVGCVQDGQKALELCINLSPDVLLIDIAMPVYSGIDVMRMIKEKNKAVKVIILTIYNDNENIKNALQNGADGYILKNINPEELCLAIRNCVNGICVISSDIMARFVKYYNSTQQYGHSRTRSDSIALVEREKDIIRLIILGKDTKEIAAVLFLSEGRVKNIISDMLQRLNLKDRTQLAILALKQKLV